MITIALAGNPNSGKTTLFNELTGSRQHVGNYPGVTVEKKEGVHHFGEEDFNIVDLPGIYSLTAYSLEEVVAREYLIRQRPAVVLNIVDASNLERNLYLTTQFMELGLPVVVALNMVDMAEKRGISIDSEKLGKLLGVPVVPIVARSGKNLTDLMTTVKKLSAAGPAMKPLKISYGKDVDTAMDEMEQEIRKAEFMTAVFHPRWLALKYLENDSDLIRQGRSADSAVSERLEKSAALLAAHTRNTLQASPEDVIADYRYGYVMSAARQCVARRMTENERLYVSDRLDKVLVNRFAGPLLMLTVIFTLYQFTFSFSAIPVGWVENFFASLGGWAEAALPEGLFKSMVISGVIDGVGGVLGFVPLILFMFLGIAFLEDSGYLARMAFMLDRIFRVFGLHGNSVMPFIVSGGIAGGCAVPGVMATRTIKSPKERLATILTLPFMNCGAKMPIFALLIGAFFSEGEALVMFAVTMTSWLGALVVARILRSTVIRGANTPFVMELPPYRFPTLKGLLIHTWERTWQYIKKAGTVILGISILIWAIMTFPGLDSSTQGQFDAERAIVVQTAGLSATEIDSRIEAIAAREAEAQLKGSWAGRIGRTLEPLSSLAGFDWRTNIALVGGVAAKEVIVSTLGTAYSLGTVDPEDSKSLGDTLQKAWTPLMALSLIIFVIFYAPCFVTVVCIARETSWGWAAFAVIFSTALAFALATAVYQGGRLAGFA